MLREYRKRAKISQDKLSAITDLDKKTIFRIENDITVPKIDTYAKIAFALNMTKDEIYNNLKRLIEKREDK